MFKKRQSGKCNIYHVPLNASLRAAEYHPVMVLSYTGLYVS